jgi:arsenate reductase (thioredoxin)
MKTVIFACIHNAGRSQMAAAFFTTMAATSAARAVSAGTQPGTRIGRACRASTTPNAIAE